MKVENTKLWCCDACGKVAAWGERDWAWYGSELLAENHPDEIFHLCSDECRAFADVALASGKWKQPSAKMNGHSVTFSGKFVCPERAKRVAA